MVNIDNIQIQIRKLHHSKFKIVYPSAIKIKKTRKSEIEPGLFGNTFTTQTTTPQEPSLQYYKTQHLYNASIKKKQRFHLIRKIRMKQNASNNPLIAHITTFRLSPHLFTL